MLFTVPIERVPARFVQRTPPALPVTHFGERVATAVRRDGTYSFHMFYGEIQEGLKSGSLVIKPVFVDDLRPSELSVRRYLSIDIVPKIDVMP